jgi:1,2-diacylglycerol 3-beta-glucosyltransferase
MALTLMLIGSLPALTSILLALIVALAGGVVVLGISYLLLLLGAACVSMHRNRKRVTAQHPALTPADNSRLPRFAVVVPAHNEELVLGATLESLRRQAYPSECMEIVIVADNCTDATAQIAKEQGAIVLERFDQEKRGKGYALQWAFAHLLDPQANPFPEGKAPDAFVIVDADTWVAPDFLAVMGNRLASLRQSDARGHGIALQGYYGVLNPSGGWRAALMTAAFELFNHIRPLGADRLGLSVGLKGNGMAFDRAVLERAEWQGHSITEDIDYGLDLLQDHGVRVGYVPDARVLAQMPETSAQAASQRERWERGRYRLLRNRVPALLRAGLRQRRLPLILAAFDLAQPPLAELVAMLIGWGLLIGIGVYSAFLPSPIFWLGAWATATVGLVTYILGGLRLAKASRQAYLALLFAPVYVVWKFALLSVRAVFRRLPGKSRAGAGSKKESEGEDAWVRTERIRIPVADDSRTARELVSSERG